MIFLIRRTWDLNPQQTEQREDVSNKGSPDLMDKPSSCIADYVRNTKAWVLLE